MVFKSAFFFIFFSLFLIAPAKHLFAESKGFDEIQKSSQVIGSPFFRHLAFDYDVDIKKLVRFEKKGFGRAETITLLLLSKMTDTPMKEYGKRRLKNDVTLKEMTVEAGLDYVTLYKTVQAIKKGIEKKGDKNMPPPVYEEKKEEE